MLTGEFKIRPLQPTDSPKEVIALINAIVGEFDGRLMPEIRAGVYHVPMSDGCRLTTHVFIPRDGEQFPVVLMRNPYNRGVAAEFFRAIAATFAAAGFASVMQECRGTGSSEGDWQPFVNERVDGLDTLRWLENLEWNNGKIGTFGPSYLTISQWLMADALPEQVKTMYLSVGGTERYRQMYMGGMFRHDIYSLWTLENSGIDLDDVDTAHYWDFIRHKPHATADEVVLGRKLPWYRDWLTNRDSSLPFWSQGIWADLAKVPSRVRVPVTLVAGWFDHHLDGMACAWDGLNTEIRKRSRFIIGPWDHSFSEPPGMPIPKQSCLGTSTITDAVAWFDKHLGNGSSSADSADNPDLLLSSEISVHQTGITAFGIGANTWSNFSDWPGNDNGIRYFLNSAEGLTLDPSISVDSDNEEFTYDPSNPVPTCGGAALLGWMNPNIESVERGAVLQPEAGYRDDVLTWMSNPLLTDMSIFGRIRVALWVSSSATDTAFSVKIIETTVSGEHWNISDGIATLEYARGDGLSRPVATGEKTLLELELWPIMWHIRRGSRIRLDISSSSFPMYHIHPNISGDWTTRIDSQIARQVIYSGPEYQSYINFPTGRIS